MSQDAEVGIRKAGKLLRDQEAELALNQMLNKLYPEYKGAMKIKILKHPILNAFAFPNGVIYIHSGIIAAAKNEAQIAAVVAHEGAHFILKHGAKARIKQSNMVSFSIFINMLGIPLVGELIGASSVMGFSRDLEREADAMGAKRMLNAGYDVREAIAMFKFMASEAKANKNKEPYFFASHPKLQERIKNFEMFSELHKDENGKIKNRNEFIKNFSKITIYALHKRLEIGQYASLINEFEYDKTLWDSLRSSKEKCVYADAYQLRAEDNDLPQSMLLNLKIIKEDPNFWRPYFSLGVIALRDNNLDSAKVYLLKAKSLNSTNFSYIDMYLSKIKNKEEKKNG